MLQPALPIISNHLTKTRRSMLNFVLMSAMLGFTGQVGALFFLNCPSQHIFSMEYGFVLFSSCCFARSGFAQGETSIPSVFDLCEAHCHNHRLFELLFDLLGTDRYRKESVDSAGQRFCSRPQENSTSSRSDTGEIIPNPSLPTITPFRPVLALLLQSFFPQRRTRLIK